MSLLDPPIIIILFFLKKKKERKKERKKKNNLLHGLMIPSVHHTAAVETASHPCNWRFLQISSVVVEIHIYLLVAHIALVSAYEVCGIGVELYAQKGCFGQLRKAHAFLYVGLAQLDLAGVVAPLQRSFWAVQSEAKSVGSFAYSPA